MTHHSHHETIRALQARLDEVTAAMATREPDEQASYTADRTSGFLRAAHEAREARQAALAAMFETMADEALNEVERVLGLR